MEGLRFVAGQSCAFSIASCVVAMQRIFIAIPLTEVLNDDRVEALFLDGKSTLLTRTLDLHMFNVPPSLVLYKRESAREGAKRSSCGNTSGFFVSGCGVRDRVVGFLVLTEYGFLRSSVP